MPSVVPIVVAREKKKAEYGCIDIIFIGKSMDFSGISIQEH